ARHARWASRLYGAPLAMPLGLGTRVHTDGADVTEALERLAERGQSAIVVVPATGTTGEPDAAADTDTTPGPAFEPDAVSTDQQGPSRALETDDEAEPSTRSRR